MTTVNIRIYGCFGKTGRWNSFFPQDTITCYRPALKTHCASFNNLLKIPVFWRNASGTPRDRWHYEANACLPACVAVLLWGKRSGLVAESGPPSFPGVSNGRHQKPYLSRSSIWLGSHLPGAGYMRAESYGSQDKDHAGGFEQGFICSLRVFCTDGPCLQKIWK